MVYLNASNENIGNNNYLCSKLFTVIVPLHHLDSQSKVWIYQCSTKLTDEQSVLIRQELMQFLEAWTSHNVQLHTGGDVYFDRFLVLLVDERYNSTGGCSIDKSVHFIEYLEQKYDISLLDRMTFAYKQNASTDEIGVSSLQSLDELFYTGEVSGDTIVFNNLVKTKAEFDTKWQIPLSQSWHMRFVKSSVIS